MTLAGLRALCERATKGPWVWTRVEPSQWGKEVGEVRSATDLLVMGQVVLEPSDAAFIAAARTWLPALIDAAQTLGQIADDCEAVARSEIVDLGERRAWLAVAKAAHAALARLDEMEST